MRGAYRKNVAPEATATVSHPLCIIGIDAVHMQRASNAAPAGHVRLRTRASAASRTMISRARVPRGPLAPSGGYGGITVTVGWWRNVLSNGIVAPLPCPAPRNDFLTPARTIIQNSWIGDPEVIRNLVALSAPVLGTWSRRKFSIAVPKSLKEL